MSKNTACWLMGVFLCATVGTTQAQLVAVDDVYGVPYAVSLQVESPGVLSNDTFDGDPAEDASATAELVTSVSFGSLECESNASLEICPDGSFIYTPSSSFSLTDSFTYRTVVGTDTAVATVTLSACNGGPSVFVCWTEASYLYKLAELGYSNFQEGYEDDGPGVWCASRTRRRSSSAAGSSGRPTTPRPTTSRRARARRGRVCWGLYDPDHGFATGTPAECDVDEPPPQCIYKDGFTGTRQNGQSKLYGVGAHYSGTAQPNLSIMLDGGAPIGLGKLFVGGHQFFGVIDTASFKVFRVEETDGKIGQSRLVFADDFVFGTTPSDNTPPQVSLLNSVDDTGDGELAEGETAMHPIDRLLVTYDELVENPGYGEPTTAW